MMEIQLWGGWLLPLFEWPGRWEAYPVWVIYTVGLLVLLVWVRQDFAALRKRRWLLYLFLLVLTPLLNNLFVLRVYAPDLLPPPYRAAEPIAPGLPLLGLLPVVGGAVWTG
ncbi:MAG TPA: hypothetical protein EYP77_10780, partial [Anaerolineae bacterium]|nr:hypothetical protein [Anaerolineae bacterium]